MDRNVIINHIWSLQCTHNTLNKHIPNPIIIVVTRSLITLLLFYFMERTNCILKSVLSPSRFAIGGGTKLTH